MIAKIKNAGATDVIQTGAGWAEADAYLREELLGKDVNGVYVPPFDHEDVWDGAATIIEELEEKPDAVVCSVGGGGLFCGMVRGLERKGWGGVNILALETKGAESLHKSLKQGELIRLERITSICNSLGATWVAEKTFEYAQRKNVKSVVLEDREAVMGCWRLADDERLLVEPACGVNVALCYDGRLKKTLARAHDREQSRDHPVRGCSCHARVAGGVEGEVWADGGGNDEGSGGPQHRGDKRPCPVSVLHISHQKKKEQGIDRKREIKIDNIEQFIKLSVLTIKSK